MGVQQQAAGFFSLVLSHKITPTLFISEGFLCQSAVDAVYFFMALTSLFVYLLSRF